VNSYHLIELKRPIDQVATSGESINEPCRMIRGSERCPCTQYGYEVVESAVIGVTDEKWGERVHAVVRISKGSTLNEVELLAHCRRQLASFKCPRSLELRHSPLPLTSTGKIAKTELKRQFRDNKLATQPKDPQ
jgi:acyl-CoA synthetase (AMP-forming)/AMP-acid ligase II